MTSQEPPNWQPITRLPLIASMIDEMLQDAQEQYKNLGEARLKPWVLDDYTVHRVMKVYTEQRDDILGLYEEQLGYWEGLSLTVTQRAEVGRVSSQLESLRTVLTDILALAEELKKGTIESQLAKDDMEIGLEALLRHLAEM